MKAIYKFPIRVADRQVVFMPRGARVLCVQEQNEILCLWALVEPDAQLEERIVLVVGTGHIHPDATFIGTYIGTVQESRLPLVWHVFEGVKGED